MWLDITITLDPSIYVFMYVCIHLSVDFEVISLSFLCEFGGFQEPGRRVTFYELKMHDEDFIRWFQYL